MVTTFSFTFLDVEPSRILQLVVATENLDKRGVTSGNSAKMVPYKQLSNEGKKIMLPSYVGIQVNRYKDPYITTSRMESKRSFF